MSKIQEPIIFEKNKIKKRKNKLPKIIVKNHIKYIISVSEGKHQFKKTFKRNKKWHIPVYLYGFEIINQEAITKLCTEKVQELVNYRKIEGMSINQRYFFLLSKTQYNIYQDWVNQNDIRLNEPFTFNRIGTSINTRYIFNINKENKSIEVKTKTIPKSPKEKKAPKEK